VPNKFPNSFLFKNALLVRIKEVNKKDRRYWVGCKKRIPSMLFRQKLKSIGIRAKEKDKQISESSLTINLSTIH
jgi:hypothetical protein